MPRENNAPGLTLPSTTPDGKHMLMLDPAVQDMVDRLHYGDPTLGWEGDPALGLYVDADGRWALYRLEHDNVLRLFAKAKSPDTPLDRGLILALVKHDQRRGFDPVKWAEEQERKDDQEAAKDPW